MFIQLLLQLSCHQIQSHCSNAPFILECEVDGRPTAVFEEKEVKLEEMKSKEIWFLTVELSW